MRVWIRLDEMQTKTYLTSFAERADESYRGYLPAVDAYLLTQYANILVDGNRYNSYINYFILAHDREFARIAKALDADYDPTKNYDFKETVYREKTAGDVEKSRTKNGDKEIERVAKGVLETVTEDQETAINSDYKNVAKQTVTSTPKNDYGETTTESYHDFNDTETIKSLTNDKESVTTTKYGNVGGVTPQDMVSQTLELESQHKIVSYIAQVFVNELTTGIYDYGEEVVIL